MLNHQECIDILLVEDNPDIAENIILYLEGKHHRVDTIYSAERALDLLKKNNYDILILDVMLPGIDGFSLAEKIRSKYKIATPILFLTARDTLNDKLYGFSIGGDDYLTKPFEMKELEARTIAIYKRSKKLMAEVITVGGWSLNQQLLEISYKNKIITTTNIGFKIFKCLLSDYPNVVSRESLEKRLWGDDPPDSDALRSHIFVLRKAISSACKKSIVETVYGIGFKLTIE